MADAGALLAKALPETDLDDAVLDVITLSVCSDGVAKGELQTLRTMVRQLPALRDLSDDDLEARVRGSFERLEARGLEERLREIGERPIDEDRRRRLFRAAAIVQYADGHLTNEENAFLLDLADAIGLTETKVREIVDEIAGELGVSARA